MSTGGEETAARVRQLEDEVRALSERLFRALDAKEECERDIEALRVEAHDVVRQWEREAESLRTELAGNNDRCRALQQQLEERDSTIAVLRAHANTLEEGAGKDAAELAALREKEQRWCAEAEQLRQNVTSCQHETRTVHEFAEQLQQEKAAAEATCAMYEERLRACEASASRLEEEKEAAAHRIAACATQLAAERAQTFATVNTCEALLRDVIADAEAAQRSLLAAHFHACEQHSHDAAALRGTEDIVRHQGQALGEVQNELREARGVVLTTRHERDELQRALADATAEGAKARQQCERAATELNTVNELYTTTLYELEECKTSSAQKQEELREQYTRTIAALQRQLELATHACEHWQSVQQTTATLLAEAQRKLAVVDESAGRYEIASAATHDMVDALQAQMTVLRELVLRREAKVRKVEVMCAEQRDELAAVRRQCTQLNVQLTGAQSEAAAARNTLTGVETKLKASEERGVECEKERARLASDNVWLSERVEAMRQELSELDELLNANLNAMREENESQSTEIAALHEQLSTAEGRNEEMQAQLEALAQRNTEATNEMAAQARTLQVAEAELARAQKLALCHAEQLASVKEAAVTAAAALATREAECADLRHSVAALQERLQMQEKRSNLVIADKRSEVAELRGKLNAYVGRVEVMAEQLSRREAEGKAAEEAAAQAKEMQARVKAAFEQLKQRCQEYGETVRRLTRENEELVADRNVVVERYNTLHEAYRAARKTAAGTAVKELTRLVELCGEQETELQRLRSENVLLKKSVAILITPPASSAASGLPEAAGQLISERLNLDEGPLRQPRRRTVDGAA